ncbi:four helix bundle protein [Flavobacterium sp.]|uniref:four helix bundle protein n=1 Tax=Flavobacterium sp. TaxID=239 RepID=UPI00375047D5
MKTFSFEKLIVWQKSKQLAVIIYKWTKNFPKEELFGMTSQMRRCSVSIASNIAEGSGRHSAKDKARFTEISYSSALELLNQTIISLELEYITEENYKLIRKEIEEVTYMLNALYKAQLKSLEA